MQKLTLFMLVLGITACANLPRQYDASMGIGYKVLSKTSTEMMFANIQENKVVSVDSEKKKILNLCAKKLAVRKGSASLFQTKSQVVDGFVTKQIAVPTDLQVDTSGNPVMTSTRHVTEHAKKKTTLRKTQFRCVVK